MVALWSRHMRLMEGFDLMAPKHHLMVHLCHRAAMQGNPWTYKVFLDESFNKDLKKTLRLCHQAAFEQMALAKISASLERLAAKRKRDG